jgi:hypothetical protein
MAKFHTLAIDILKNEVDKLTKQIMAKEQLIATTVLEAEELQSIQNEIIESIKHLGGNNNVGDEQPSDPNTIN